jgi:hypothetical protein
LAAGVAVENPAVADGHEAELTPTQSVLDLEQTLHRFGQILKCERGRGHDESTSERVVMEE